jgi:hypothetical protein
VTQFNLITKVSEKNCFHSQSRKISRKGKIDVAGYRERKTRRDCGEEKIRMMVLEEQGEE